jgi:hypothetical protein
MSANSVKGVRQAAERAAVDAAWQQWSALTSSALPAGRRRPWAIVDPEALVLLSLTVGKHERRLEDLVASWAREASFLMSLQRLRTLSATFPESVRSRVGDFARYAVEGGDRRWTRLASVADPKSYSPRVKPLGPLQLIEAPALLLRLRAGFGVNAKADVTALLLGLQGAAAGLKVIALGTGYTERAVRTATEEMVLGGFIREIEGRPSSFYMEPGPWAQVLQTYPLDKEGAGPGIPPWRFWAAIYAFLAGVIDWANQAERDGWGEYVASSRARDLVGRHETSLFQAGFRFPAPEHGRGTEYLTVFAEIVKQLATWVREGL